MKDLISDAAAVELDGRSSRINCVSLSCVCNFYQQQTASLDNLRHSLIWTIETLVCTIHLIGIFCCYRAYAASVASACMSEGIDQFNFIRMQEIDIF